MAGQIGGGPDWPRVYLFPGVARSGPGTMVVRDGGQKTQVVELTVEMIDFACGESSGTRRV